MRLLRFLLVGLTAVSFLGVAGCGFIPMSGPASLDVMKEVSPTLPYSVVKLDAHALQVIESYEPNVFGGVFVENRPPSSIVFGIGDVVNVTIFEAAAGGLFIPNEAGVRPGNFVNLPSQTVDNDGNITVPYAGVIKAAGWTNVIVQNEILKRIKDRAIEPQVIVSLVEQKTSLMSVIGDVRAPLRFPNSGSRGTGSNH